MPKERFLAYYSLRKRFDKRIDSLHFTTDSINNKLSVLTGRAGNKLVVIADADNDGSFANDKVFVVADIRSGKVMDTSLSFITSHVEIFADEKKTEIDPMPVSIRLNFPARRDSLSLYAVQSADSWMEYVSNHYKIGHVTVAGQPYRVLVFTSPYEVPIERIIPSIHIFSAGDTINNRQFFQQDMAGLEYKMNDTFRIKDKYFKLVAQDQPLNTVQMVPIEGKAVTGYTQGFYIKEFTGKIFDTDKSFDSKVFAGKYTLIDFWGTWCEPCIKLFPELRSLVNDLQRKYHDQFAFLSILYDTKEQTAQARKLIGDLGVEGTCLFDQRDLSNTSSLVKKMNVTCYPTTILVDPKGRIVFRGCTETALQEIRRITKL